jgi:tetratricopeptide (TPR) repeat protein
MSLLLEALKKAEKAKEEAQRRAKGEAHTSTAEVRGDAEDVPAEKPVLTRPELPDIRQPLEILSDDISPRAPEAQPAPASAPATERPAQSQAADRATARKVFEAKFKEPNPRLPFYITLGLLGVFGVGVCGYFWYQLRPPAPLVNANPPRAAAQELASSTAPEPRPAPGLPPLAAGPATIAGLPQAATQPPTATPLPKPVPEVSRAPRPAAAPRFAPIAPTAAPRLATPAVAHTRPKPQIHPKVESAYAAYLAGDLATARADYQAALREDVGNRDALLGLAAIDVRGSRYEAAEASYLRLLQADPNDAHAQAGMIALRASRLDPLATESRVKTLLAADPGANVLHFTLGNQLAQQRRWAEAQQEYFKAFAAEPDNADFAFNLAVSLDHLRQSKLALDYYRRAIDLAEKRGASFDLASARSRAAQLAN